MKINADHCLSLMRGLSANSIKTFTNHNQKGTKE